MAAIFRTNFRLSTARLSTIWLCLVFVTGASIAVCQNHGSGNVFGSALDRIESKSGTRTPVRCRLRISWGGGTAKRWRGFIRCDGAEIDKPTVLGFNDDSASSFFVERHQVSIKQPLATTFEGIDVDIIGHQDSIVNVQLSDDVVNEPIFREFSLSQLLAKEQIVSVDQHGNRLSVSRAPGDRLQFKTTRRHLVFEPGESFPFEFRPYPSEIIDAIVGDCVLEIIQARNGGSPVWSTTVPVDSSEWRSANFVQQTINVPNDDGVYNLRMTIRPRHKTDRSSENELVREIQFVVVDGEKRANNASVFDELVFEVDPANLRASVPHQLNQLSKIIGLRSNPQPMGVYEVNPETSLVQLPVGGWQAVPLSIRDIGKPHVVEIDYPAGSPMSVGFSILQADETGNIPNFGFDSGINISRSNVEQTADSNQKLATHRFVFWPNSKQIYLLVANRNQKTTCRYHNIRVFADSSVSNNLAGESKIENDRLESADRLNRARKMMSFYEQPLFAENFEVNNVHDSGIGQSVNDWVTFYDGVIRLAQYLKDTGSGGAFINVIGEGSALMPLSAINPSPRYDSGVFSSLGHDPFRKDVVELIYRVFEREGLQFIPVVTFDQRLSTIEFHADPSVKECAAVVDYRKISRQPFESNDVPVYNPLCPDVQDHVTKIIGEIADRYRHKQSYRGLAIVCRPDAYTLLPGGNVAGYDDATLARFAGTENTSHSDNVLSDENYVDWLNWRTDQMTAWYREISRRVTGQSNQAQLFLALIDAYRNEEVAGILAPSLHRTANVANAMQRIGIHKELGNASIVLMQPTRLAPIHPLTSKKSEYSIQKSQKLNRWFADQDYSTSLFSHRSSWARFENLEGGALPGRQSEAVLRLQQLNPAGLWNRERFATALLNTDSRMLVDGGLLLNSQIDRELKRFIGTFSKLPDEPFVNVQHVSHPNEVHPIAVRLLQKHGETYLYCVNGSPWEVSANIESAGQIHCEWSVLGETADGRQLPAIMASGQIRMKLAPFALAAIKLESDRLNFEQFSYELPKTAQRDLTTSYYKLKSRLIASGNAKPLSALQDPSFETGGLGNGWTTGNQQTDFLRFDSQGSLQGAQSLQINNLANRNVWVRSNKFTPPVTGRLSVSVWLKTNDSRQQPPLRISIESSDPKSNYYRFAELGSLISDRKQHQLTTDWKRFAVHFDDLPQEPLSGLRVGFDMIGSGQVQIDQVEVFDRWMDEIDLKAMTQMFASVGPLMQQPEKLERCRQILNGYWPVFLREYFDENAHVAVTGANEKFANEQKPPTIRSSMRKRFKRFVSPGIFQFR